MCPTRASVPPTHWWHRTTSAIRWRRSVCGTRPLPFRRRSDVERVAGVDVDVVALERVVDGTGVDLTRFQETGQDADHHMAHVDLEEPAQRFACIGSTHAVGAEHVENTALRHEARDLLGHHPHEVTDGGDRTL